jgi:carboxypeptidase Taq
MVQKVFNRSGDPLMSAKGLARVYHRVKPGFIRVSADEMTYPCHIILRFEIEQALVEGKIECADLPEIWDQKMQELLGLSTQGNDKDGVMQDVHWPSAAFGYFPCYTFGALIAAQLAHRLKQDIKNFSQLVEGAQLEPICQWLHDHVWRWGCYYSTDDLIQSATGEPLNTKYFIEHLKERYLS